MKYTGCCQASVNASCYKTEHPAKRVCGKEAKTLQGGYNDFFTSHLEMQTHLFGNNVFHFFEESAINEVIVKQFTNYQRLCFVKIHVKRLLD